MPSRTIPTTLNFVNSKALTEQQAEYIKIWAKKHPEYTVNVWRDTEAVIDQYFFRQVFNHVTQDQFGTPESSPVGFTLEKFSRIVKGDFELLSENPLRPLVYRGGKIDDSYIRRILETSTIKYENDFKKTILQEEKLYDHLASVENIQVHEVSTTQDIFDSTLYQNNNSLAEFYFDYRYGNAYPIAEFVIALNVLKGGGFYINSGVLPELHFEPLSEAQKLSMPEDIQQLFKKAAIELVLQREWTAGNNELNVNSSVFKLEKTEYNSDLSELKKKINNLKDEDLFKKIDNKPLQHPDSIILESIDSESLTKIAVLGTTSDSTLLSALRNYHLKAASQLQARMDELANQPAGTKFNYNLFNLEIAKLHDTLLLNRNQLAALPNHDNQNQQNKADPVRAKWAAKAYYSLPYLNVAPELNRYGDVLGDAAVRKYYESLNYGEPEKLFHKDHVYPPYDQPPVATVEPSAKYVRGQNYDSQIIISLGDDPMIYTQSYLTYSNIPINKRALFHYDQDSDHLSLVHGKSFEPGEATRIIIDGHANDMGFKMARLMELKNIFRQLMPQGGKVKRIVLVGCRIASNNNTKSGILPKDSFEHPGLLLKILKKYNIYTHDLIAFKTKVSKNFLSNKIFITGERPNRTESRELVDVRYVYTLMEDGNISFTVKENLPALSPDIQLRPDLFNQNELTSIFGQNSIVSHDTSTDIRSHNILTDSDINTVIQLGILGSLSKKTTIVVTEPDKTKYNQIIEVLSSTQDFKEYIEWKSWLNTHHPDLVSSVENTVNKIYDWPAHYSLLRNRIVDGVFSFTRLNPTSIKDASIIKQRYPEGFARIYLKSVPAHELCRSRRSLSGNDCRLNFDDEKSSLKLLSDDKTSLVVSEFGDRDILLLDPSNKPRLSAFQQSIREMKAELTDSAITKRYGYHNAIAMNPDSLAEAKRLIAKSKLPGKAFLLNSKRGVLLDDNNAVYVKIEGGSGNSLTLLGNPDSLDPKKLIGTVKRFAVKEHVGQLTVGIIKNGISVTSVKAKFSLSGLNELKGVAGGSVQLQMIDPGKMSSPFTNLKTITRLDNGVVISNYDNVIKVPSTSIDGQFMTGSALSHTQSAMQLAEKKTFAQYAVQVGEEAMLARRHIDYVASGLSEALSKKGLAQDFIPDLGSLKQKGKNWQLRVFTVNEQGGITRRRSLTISDPSLVNSLKFINDRVHLSKQSFQQVAKHKISSMDAIGDGLGMAMTFGSLIYQMLRNDQLQADQAMPPTGTDLQRRILEAQVILGTVSEQIGTADALLTLGKYVNAMRKGQGLTSLSERMANYLDKHRTSTSAAGGKAVSTIGTRALRLSGPVTSLALSVGTVTLDAMALSNCETKHCRENAGLMLGLNLAQTVPIAVSLGASAASAVGLVSAAAATAVSFLASAMAIPIAFVSLAVMLIDYFAQKHRAAFENSMGFWQMIYEDLTFKSAKWASTTKTWDLISKEMTVRVGTGKYRTVRLEGNGQKVQRTALLGRHGAGPDGIPFLDDEDDKAKTKQVEIMVDEVRDRLSLAPITGIDFAQKSASYGDIKVYSVSGKGGVTYYEDGDGPLYRRVASFNDCNGSGRLEINDYTTNILKPEAVKFLRNNLQWPEGDIETVILPVTKNWKLRKWDKTVQVSDATSWGDGRSDGKGWELLMQASRASDDTNNGVFAFAFKSLVKGIKRAFKEAEDLCDIKDAQKNGERALIIDDMSDPNNIQFFGDQTLEVRAAHYNQTFVATNDRKMSYSFYGKPGYNYTVIMSHFNKADLFRVGDEQWTIIDKVHAYTIKDFQPLINREPVTARNLVTLKAPEAIEKKPCPIRFHNFNASTNPYPLVVVDKYRYPHYIYDSKAAQFKVYYPEIKKDGFQLSYYSRSRLWQAYKNPLPDTYTLNKPKRFHELSDGRWMDVEPAMLTFISLTGQSTSRLLKGRIVPKGSSEEQALPTDVAPIGGVPNLGYLFYSLSKTKLFYRQPTSQADGDLIEIPGQFANRVDIGSDRIQGFFKSDLGVIYQLEKVRQPEGESRFVPVIKPVRAIWAMPSYQDSVNEMKRFDQGDLPVPALIVRKAGDKKAFTKGFFDPRANSGVGRVLIWSPFGRREQFFIDNSLTWRSERIMEKKFQRASNMLSLIKDNGATLDLIAAKHDSDGDRYLFFRKDRESAAFHLVDTSDLSNRKLISTLQASVTSAVFPARTLFNHDRKQFIHAALSPENNEVLFTLNDSVVFGISRTILDPLLAPARERGQLDLGNHELWVRGVNYPQTRPLRSTSNRIRVKLTPYINKSLKPVMRVPDIVPVHGYVPSEYSNKPYDVISWYIVDPGFIYVTRDTINLLGLDKPSSTLYAYNTDTKQVLSAKCNRFIMRCAKLTVYTPYRYDYKNLFLKDGGVFGTEHNGNIYRIKKQRRVLLSMDISRDLREFDLQAASSEELKTKINGIVQPKLNETGQLEGTEVPEDISLGNLQAVPKHQFWYHTAKSKVAAEGLYMFNGTQEVSFLGGTVNKNDTINWFYSPSSRQLFKQENDVIQAQGAFTQILSVNDGNSLSVTGSADTKQFPAIRLGQPQADTTLHLNGKGNDYYPVTKEMLEHYQSIVIDNRALIKSDKNAFITALRKSFSPTRSVVDISLPANEFAAFSGEKSLQLLHHPTGHSLFLPAYHYQKEEQKEEQKEGKVGTGGLSFRTGNIQLRFVGLDMSLKALLKQTQTQPGVPWQLPVDITQLPLSTQLVASQSHPLKLQVPDGHNLRNFRSSEDSNGWRMVFRAKDGTKAVNIKYEDKVAARSGNVWITSDQGNIPVHFFNGLTSKIKNSLPALRSTLSAIKNQQYAFEAASEDGFSYRFVSSHQLAGSDGSKSTALSSSLANISENNVDRKQEWLILDRHSGEDGLKASYMPDTFNDPTSETFTPVFHIDDKSRKQTAVFRYKPEAVVFARNPLLKGWLLKTAEGFAAGHSGADWLISDENAYVMKFTPQGQNAITQLPDPVLYNVRADQLSVERHPAHHLWTIRNQNHLVLKIKGEPAGDNLSLTLAERVGTDIVRSSRYLVMPYSFDQWAFHNRNDQFAFYLGSENGIGVGLSPLFSKGYFPEKQMADLLMAKSLNMYEGIYFADGLQNMSQIRQNLMRQPLTAIMGKKDGNGFSYTGNNLDNVINVSVSSRKSKVTIHGNKGDDFIQVFLSKERDWHKHIASGLNADIRRFSQRQHINVDGGAGSNILNLSDPLRVKVKGPSENSSGNSSEENVIFVSAASRADMVELKQWILFVRGLTSEQVEPVLVAQKGNKYQQVSLPEQATEVFLRTVDKPFLFARVSVKSSGSLYFADGHPVTNFQEWINHRAARADTSETPTTQPAIQPTESTISATLPESISHSDSVNATTPLVPQTENEVGRIRKKLESVQRYQLQTETVRQNDLAQQNLNRLIHEMAQFAAKTESASDFIPGVNQTISPSYSLASPLASSTAT